MNKFTNINYPNNCPATQPAACQPRTNLRSEVKYTKDRAEAGIPESSITFAMMLFKGVWDCEQMKIDALCNCLQTPQADSRLDPYLILPKDPLRAVQIFKRVIETAQPDQTFFKNKARDLLVFCQVNGLAGLPVGVITYSDAQSPCPFDEEALLVNGRSSDVPSSVASNYGFTPLPDVRPVVADPIGNIFKGVATSSRDMSFWLGIFFTVAGIGLSILVSTIAIPCLILTLIFIALPFSVFYYLEDTYGVKQKLPICDCQRIRVARELTFEEYPPQFTQNALDPFNNSPVKNLIRIKHFIFWIYLLTPFIALAGHNIAFYAFNINIFDGNINISAFKISLFIWPFVLSFVGMITLIVEMKKGCENDWAVFCIFFYFCLHDSSCHEQAMSIIRKWNNNGVPKYAQLATVKKMND